MDDLDQSPGPEVLNSPLSAIKAPSSTPSTSYASRPTPAASSEPPGVQPLRSNSTSTSSLNPRSCVTCRRRKVRCNKEIPCSNCQRAGIECIFPGPGRAPRKTKKPPDAELLARLRKLESVVTNLGAQVDENGVLHQEKKLDGQRQGSSNSPESPAVESHRTIGEHLGRLVINEDRSRYVSNQFWASMGDEIAEMRDLLDADGSDTEQEEYESPHDRFSSHQGFIFGHSSLKVDLKSLHPSASQIFILWEVFKENVDPVVKILHRPTAKNILLNAASSVDKVSKPAEALLFAIYFGAVVSLTTEQCRQLLDEDKAELIKKYRFATEQALARADFLNSSSLMCLQAFVFFLVFVRHMDDSRLVWALSGLTIHLAQALGIHRDGSQFGLTPFDIEMRRRLWWHISILDNRSAEDHGTDPTFSESFYDTKLPLNVNDDDIYPDMKEPPHERTGSTEMTFCLIRFELSVSSRRLNLTCPGGPSESARKTYRTFEEKEQLIDACHRRMEEKYLQHCDMSIPIFWVSATVARLILAKMWLMVHHPKQFMLDHDGQLLPAETKDRLFVTSVEVIEFSSLLEKNENTAKWGWLFRTYMQWQSVAFALSEIIVRPPGPEVDRAWSAIETVCRGYLQNGMSGKSHKGMLWRPLKGLLAKAKKVRKKQMREGKIPASRVNRVNQSERMGADGGSNSIPNQPQFDFQTDPWAIHMSDANNIIGASAEAFDMDLDISALMSPGGSEGSGSGTGPSQGQKHPIPRAMASVFDNGQGQGQVQEQMQGVAHSPTLSVSSDFGSGVGTTASDLSGHGGLSSASRIPGLNSASAPGIDGGFNFNAPDFLNWTWNPGVGDFSVAPPMLPDPVAEFWDESVTGPTGGAPGAGGQSQQQQQQWY